MEAIILVATLGLLVAVALILKSQQESLRSLDQKLEMLTLLLKSSLEASRRDPGDAVHEKNAAHEAGRTLQRPEAGPSGSSAASHAPLPTLAVAMERDTHSTAESPAVLLASEGDDALPEQRDVKSGQEKDDTAAAVSEAASAQLAATQPMEESRDVLATPETEDARMERQREDEENAAPHEDALTQEVSQEVAFAQQTGLIQETELAPKADIPHGSESLQENEDPGLESASEATPSNVEQAAEVITEQPSAKVEGLVRTVFNFIRGGNIWVAGGVLLLLAGFSFLISFMAERGLLSVEMSIALAALGGIAMVVFGLFLRHKKRIYAMVMQGGGIGVLYLAAFAAAKLTTVLSPAAALLLMTLLIIPAVILAMKQQAEVLAIFGFLGGYAAPILLSTGSGDYVLLFSYYMVLNITLLGICKFRLWRWLNLLGATCSFGVMGAWGILSYEPSMFVYVEPFLLGFMVIFLLITLISMHKREFSLTNPPDMSLALGVPLAAMAFQWKAAAGLEHGLSLSALAFGAFFILLAALLRKLWGEKARRLMEIYAAAGALLANLSIPLEFSGAVTSGIWAAEGALTFFFGCRYGSGKVKTAGLGLQAAAMASFSFGLTFDLQGQEQVLLETTLLALSPISSAYWHKKQKEREDLDADTEDTGFSARLLKLVDESLSLDRLLVFAGLFWWFTGLGVECWRFAEEPGSLFFLLASASSALCFVAGKFLRLPSLFASLWVIVAISLVSLLVPLLPEAADALHIFFLKTVESYPFLPGVHVLSHNFLSGIEGLSWLVYAVALAVCFITSSTAISEKLKSHLASVCALEAVLLLTCSCRALAFYVQLSPVWADLAGVLPSLAYIFFVVTAIRLAYIPLSYVQPLFVTTPLALFAALAIWVVCGFTNPGDPGPQLGYIPLLNPLELQQALCFGMFLLWGLQLHVVARRLPRTAVRRIIQFTTLLAFAWLHSIIVRVTHFYSEVPFGFDVWHDNLFQVLLTALWGFSGMAAIALGHARRLRLLWIAGAFLIALDTAKLFFKDLADKDTLYHIISLFVVGVIFLLVGLMAPLPPATGKEEQADEANSPESGEQAQERD